MKGFIRLLSFAIITYIVLSSLIGLLREEKVLMEECTDNVQVINRNGDRLHQRDWELLDYTSSFCTGYRSSEEQSNKSRKRRDQISVDAYEYKDLWGKVYRELVREGKGTIDFLIDSLISISVDRNLNRVELAEMVVTFVQDIPYSYILGKDCETYETKGKPCVGNVALGILSPYEFIHTLHGDCDTRSVLIYAILSELGYDPMIVISYQYAHAMLALNVPAAGDHLKHRGNNYYFWETTAKGWPIGMLPPSTGNVKYWEIALVNEL